MITFLRKLPIFIIVFLVISCSSKYDYATPRIEGPQLEFKDELVDASEDFRQGWNDGCEVGSDSASKSFYKIFSKTNKADGWKMRDSADYRIAWGNAYWFCYRDDYIDHKSTALRSFFGGWQ